MPVTTPQLHPGRQVERIREILVGRQMQSVEQRLERLESSMSPMPTQSSVLHIEEQLAQVKRANEEAIHDLRDEIDASRLRQLEETRRLSQQIQVIARGRGNGVQQTRETLEQNMGEWFNSWQVGLQQHLQKRESTLVEQLREELERIRSSVREEIAKQREVQPELSQLKTAFDQISEATRLISEQLPKAPTPPPIP